ncbi:hypothetical protein MsAg5_04090 [Methanosarcinaceae archaeon Ag5]|uniref:Small multi-drug export protein n=1 Tax=Methanolapillus africanus TaxID=3028297 RepID=A0AAE4MI15_9EURY|nr:hypothetical protein [Methanosarcinaceae archaeon Ag5]
MDFTTPVVELLAGFPPWLVIMIISALPVVGLQGSIPVGIGLFDMNPIVVLGLSVLGNMIPVFFIFHLLEPVSKFLSKRSPYFEKFFKSVYECAEKQGQGKVKKYKSFALMMFVAFPMPMTGVWMGTVAAIVFRFPFRNAFFSIFGGVVIVGIVITIATVTGIHIIDFLYDLIVTRNDLI